MRFDLHIHTSAHSGCSRMAPDEMARTALARGLDGVVLTEHDYLWSPDEVARLQARFPALTILRGVEISTAEGHALVYGVTEAEMQAFYPHIPLTDLVRQVHQVGGLVVLAHPARYHPVIPRVAYRAGLDAIEVSSMNVREYMRAPIAVLGAALNVPEIVTTDAHATDALGFYWIGVESSVATMQDLIAAVKAQAFTLHRDDERIAAYNRGVEAHKVQVQRALAESPPLSEAEIKDRYRIAPSFQRAVREKRDMRLLHVPPVSSSGEDGGFSA